jgi:D-beta-D-heptose 7-phosphate kinase/D-beta-D-heptose 1-phosphate adenosyltransferase
MYEKLLKTVTNLGSPRILVVGDFMLDIYTYGDALRISPEAPVPVLKVTKTEYSCGGAGSVANDLAALGAVPYCIGVIGEDNNGQILKEKLIGVGANIDGLTTVAERPTISKQRLIGLAQHRHQQQLFRMDNEITEPMPDDVYDEILLCCKDALKEIDIVCLQDYKKGLLTETFCQDLMKHFVRI